MFCVPCCQPPATYVPIAVGTEVVCIAGSRTGQSGKVTGAFEFREEVNALVFSFGFLGYIVDFKGVGEKRTHWGSIVPVAKRGDEEEDFDITKIEESDNVLV